MKQVSSGNYDVIVVGSGPGGATVARELSRQGKKALILEWGGNDPIKGSPVQCFFMAGVPGKSVLVTNKKMLLLIRGITTGGSSVFYCGTAFDPPFEMLERHGIDISDEIGELKQELPIAPLADELIGPMAARMMDSARDLGYGWNKLNKFIIQDKCKAGCWRCSFGCPYGAKWNARFYVEDAVAHGAELVNGAKVTRVLFEDHRAAGVEYVRGGAVHKVHAPTVVVSAGGIGSAEILRRSGAHRAGYNFFFDPLVFATGYVKGLGLGAETQMAGGMHVNGEYVMTDLALPKTPHMMIMIKIKDELGGRITDRGGVRKDLSAADKKKLDDGFGHAKKILRNAGVKNVYKTFYTAAHPGGTVKIGETVDADLKSEYDNLYVCDCSVIPEAWGLPPTLTILGLGKRLSKHLLARAA